MDSPSVLLETFNPAVPSCRGINTFHMLEIEGRERNNSGKGKKTGQPSNTEMRRLEGIGRVRVVCLFSSPDFTLVDKS